MAWKILKQNKNYSINEHGEIKNNATGKIKKPTLNKNNGYYCVDLYENNKRKIQSKEKILRLSQSKITKTKNQIVNLQRTVYGLVPK